MSSISAKSPVAGPLPALIFAFTPPPVLLPVPSGIVSESAQTLSFETGDSLPSSVGNLDRQSSVESVTATS